MKLTNAQKQSIRGHWPNYKLRFLDNGIVLAKKSKGSPFGVLYTAEQTAAHIKSCSYETWCEKNPA